MCKVFNFQLVDRWTTAVYFTQTSMPLCMVECTNTNVMRRMKALFGQKDSPEHQMKVHFVELPIPQDDYDKMCAALLGIPFSHYNVCLMDPAYSSRIHEIIERDGLSIICKRTQTKVNISEILPPRLLKPVPVRHKVDATLFD